MAYRGTMTEHGGRIEIGADVRPCPDCVTLATVDERLEKAGVPKPAQRSFQGWRPDSRLREAREACEALLRGERSVVYLLGSYGIGKSHLAKATLRAWFEQGGWGLYRNVPRLMDELRATQQRIERQWQGAEFDEDRMREGSQLTDKLSSLEHCELLILDDLGAQKPTEWASEQLYKIVENRRENEAPLIVTSNTRDHEEQEHGRLLDRLRVGEVVISEVESKRREFER